MTFVGGGGGRRQERGIWKLGGPGVGIQGKEEEETVMKINPEQPSERGRKRNEESRGLGLGGV